ncbi:MAG: hypothetical protein ACR2K1_14770 [Saprospiraceae bacterium]
MARLLLFFCALLLWCACALSRQSSGSKSKPPAPVERVRADTLRPQPRSPQPPSPSTPPAKTGEAPSRRDTFGGPYRMALLLPFFSEQFNPAQPAIPDKARQALQFLAGAQIALQKTPVRLAIEVVESPTDDAAFQTLLVSGRLDRAQIIVGPMRSSRVELVAAKTRAGRQILLSPTVPVSGLTTENPGFIQLNPSLRAHCAALIRYARAHLPPDQIVLVCKQKETDRLPYCQEANAALGGARLRELVLPDEGAAWKSANMADFLKKGKKTAFVVPSWASQDFIMSFFIELLRVKGAEEVEVYGMPQWENFEQIEPEYLRQLNVHISSSTWVDHARADTQEFETLFLQQSGTLPDDYAFHGYQAVKFAADMLARYGLDFPERLPDIAYPGLRGKMFFEKIRSEKNTETAGEVWDYLENTAVQILKFEQYGFRTVH